MTWPFGYNPTIFLQEDGLALHEAFPPSIGH